MFNNCLKRLIITLAVAISIVWSISGNPANKYYTPMAYTDRVNSIIRAGYLTVNCTPGTSPQIDASILTAPVSPTDNAELKAAKLWYRESSLKSDIQRFNTYARYNRVFEIDNAVGGCVLTAINHTAHSIVLPFADLQSWEGRILYSQESQTEDAILKSSNRYIGLRIPQLPNGNEKTKVGAAASIDGANTVAFNFDGMPAAHIQYIDDRIVLSNLVTNLDSMVSVLGYAMPVGRNIRLEPGDWIQMQHNKTREAFVLVDSTPQPIASVIQRQNGASRRHTKDDKLGWLYDDATGQPVPFLRTLTQQLDTIVNKYPQVNAKFDIQLTIQRQFQERISSKFHAICDGYRRTANGGQPFKAGITVMDGKTGDLLAMATYPWPQDIPADIENPERLLRNQNFVRHLSGSTIKPFMYAAIAHQHPYLLTMEIDAYKENRDHRQVVNCTLADGYHVDGYSHGNRINFSTALTRSSNKYTVELAALALAAGQNGIGYTGTNCQQCRKIKISGNSLTRMPDFTTYIAVTRNNNVFSCNASVPLSLSRLPYLDALENLTGVPTYMGLNPNNQAMNKACFHKNYAVQTYDMDILEPLLTHFAGPKETRDCDIYPYFMGIAPEQVNFDFNHFNSFRNDYVTFALGGGSSDWTNIQLAEAMSRLVTNREINARFMTLIDPTTGQSPSTPPTQGRAWQPLRDDVRNAVLTGLVGVVTEPRGTATTIRPAFASLQQRFPGYKLFILSKTGTPKIKENIPAITGPALQGVARFLSYTNGTLQLNFANQTVNYDPNNPSSFRTALLDILRRGTPQYRGKAADNVAGALILIFKEFYYNQAAFSWNATADLPTNIGSPLYLLAGNLKINAQDSVFKNAQRDSWGGVYIFSLVKIPNDLLIGNAAIPTVGQIQDARSQVITVAMHLFFGPGSSVAVQVAAKLLEHIAAFDR